ncbi:hypothetical protein FHL15_006696 [Xylaria flabelliformis]|uniref:Uncharacterized protein n=1 Tax=Xylaria flabelliformis TaxID=2512241 RepID=A0A553HWJ4_9PEZI|nr:hypothetical protein FHL15_006696 [Xylaria flabelliformis]
MKKGRTERLASTRPMKPKMVYFHIIGDRSAQIAALPTFACLVGQSEARDRGTLVLATAQTQLEVTAVTSVAGTAIGVMILKSDNGQEVRRTVAVSPAMSHNPRHTDPNTDLEKPVAADCCHAESVIVIDLSAPMGSSYLETHLVLASRSPSRIL